MPLDAPSFLLTSLDGGTELFSRYRGKTVIFNVWATWCAPCRVEMPELDKLESALDPTRFSVLGVSVDQDPDMVREYLRQQGVRFRQFIDPEQRVTKGVLDVAALPETIVFSEGGTILARVVGRRDWGHPDLVRQIEDLGRQGRIDPTTAAMRN